MDYLINFEKYTGDSITAAVDELRRRGKTFTDEELRDINSKIEIRKQADNEDDELFATQPWGKGTTDSNDELTNDNIYNPSPLKKTIVVTGLLISLFGGLFASIVAIDNFRNYDSPYLFGVSVGAVGFIICLIVARKMKPYVLLNPTMLTNYFQVTLMFSVGFIGASLYCGQIINSRISTLYKCDNFIVVDKYQEEGPRRVEKNILIIDVDGEYKRLLCRSNYWNSASIGQEVNVCIYKSPIKFDYCVLPFDK